MNVKTANKQTQWDIVPILLCCHAAICSFIAENIWPVQAPQNYKPQTQFDDDDDNNNNNNNNNINNNNNNNNNNEIDNT